MKLDAAIVGVGASAFGRFLPDSQLSLAATALKAALDDCGLQRDDIDGLSIHMGSPLGVDYDRVASAFGLNIRYVNQSWLHGRFVTNALQHAALAVSAGLADVVACVTAISFTREREILGGPGDAEGNREEGGTHGESPPYGLTAPAGGAALSMQRYLAITGADRDKLAAVPMSIRDHAVLNPDSIMRQPLTLQAYQDARTIVDPLRLFDCCLVNDGAVVALVTAAGSCARPEAEAGAPCRHAGHPHRTRRIHLRAARPGHRAATVKSRALPSGRSRSLWQCRCGSIRGAGGLHLRCVLAAGIVRA